VRAEAVHSAASPAEALTPAAWSLVASSAGMARESLSTVSKPAETRPAHVVGVRGFEPRASWSQTRRSDLTELHPVDSIFAFQALTGPGC
jgi:hypothetical protein